MRAPSRYRRVSSWGRSLEKSGEHTERAVQEQTLFGLAKSHSGIVTAVEAARALDMEVQDADRLLSDMAKRADGRVSLEVDNNGSLYYVLREQGDALHISVGPRARACAWSLVSTTPNTRRRARRTTSRSIRLQRPESEGPMTNRMTRRRGPTPKNLVLGLFLAPPGRALFARVLQVRRARRKGRDLRAGWADIDAQLQRRYDLIPNLVATVKGSAAHEQKTLEKVDRGARASGQHQDDERRSHAIPAKMAAFQKAQDELKGSLSRLLVVQEQYPDLKANSALSRSAGAARGDGEPPAPFARGLQRRRPAIQRELNKIGGSVVNKVTGKPFKPRVYFAASAGAQAAPAVSF